MSVHSPRSLTAQSIAKASMVQWGNILGLGGELTSSEAVSLFWDVFVGGRHRQQGHGHGEEQGRTGEQEEGQKRWP